MGPNGALILASLAGLVTPWAIHILDGFFETRSEVQHGYVAAYFLAIAASLMAVVGSIWRLHLGFMKPSLGVSLGLGLFGLGSAGFVFLLGMM